MRDVSTCEDFKKRVAAEVAALGGDGAAYQYLEPEPPPREVCERRKAYMLGVYFLMRGNDVVYVGMSRNVISRIAQHMQHAWFEFDSYSVTECHTEAEALELEAKMIQDLCPPENAIYPAHGDRPFKQVNRVEADR